MITGYSNQQMPNQHDPRKRSLAVYISRERYYQVKRLAAREGISMSRLLEILVEQAVRDIELTPEDYEQIASEIRNARSGKVHKFVFLSNKVLVT